MTALIALLTLVLLAAVIFMVTAPLRRGRGEAGAQNPERDDLEVARAAKYQEIRDAELDFRTGKLSDEDYQSVDGSLRAEAVEILDQLETSEGVDAPSNGRLETTPAPLETTPAPLETTPTPLETTPTPLERAPTPGGSGPGPLQKDDRVDEE